MPSIPAFPLALPVVLAALLSGCASAPAPVVVPPASTAATAPTLAAPPPVEAGFVQPRDCAAMLSAHRLDEFARDGRELLGGPGGRYGGDYLIDETPEELAGGITCIWGDESAPATTITISVAPLGSQTRPTVVADLRAQGLNEQALDDIVRFGQLGDTVSSPAILNVLREDCWISIINARGGETEFDVVVTIADEVASAVYGAD